MSKTENILIAYFSYSENSRRVAELIQEKTGGDIFRIETVNPYPTDYNAVVDQAKREQEYDYRPKLAAQVDDMVAYDVVFVGYPNWWITMPMPVFTFFEQYDFSGKMVIPFCTHRGTGLGQSVDDIMELCPNSTIIDGLEIMDDEEVDQQIDMWLDRIPISSRLSINNSN
ncbi:flavodoxin [Clostridium folliculivorans]|uniref:Flavodoxin n=1 Tax=Clostridium folliculivorans TaxID=2886038 RepID=A0A9W6D8W0_9CLOT|nr:flavodoxin [Clostridium folliculivorans]GKU23730.1 flavodoxin [Clostridium folliculivorans]GKU29846.1 flavodoxin [Clostridium folliculivorans]